MKFKDAFDKILYGDVKRDSDDNELTNEDFQSDNDTVEASSTKSTGYADTNSKRGVEVKVVKPDRLDNTTITQIADHLLSGKTVVLNLEDTSKESSRRLIDFMSGAAYAINGNLKKVASCTYVVTPSNVDVTGEQIKESQEEN